MGIVCANPICNICTCMTCCGYNNPKYPISQINKNWMEKLAKKNPDLKLRDTIIPGTHNSGTETISQARCCSSLAITQNKSIYGQLLVGARLLDLRLSGHGEAPESVYIQHGPMRGGLYIEALEDVARFTKENPSETVFFGVQVEFGMTLTNQQLIYTHEVTKQKLGALAVTEQEIRTVYHVERVTVKDAYASKNKVLLMIDGPLRGFQLAEGRKPDFSWGYLDRDFFLSSRWFNTNDRDRLFNSALWNIKSKETMRHRFVNTQMILSGQGGSIPDLTRMILGCNSLRVDNMISDLIDQNELEFFMREYARSPWNMIWYDFIDYFPYLNKFLIGLNYTNYELKITEATLTKGSFNTIDVTERARRILELCRNNSFFVVSFTEDFNLYKLNVKYGTFNITYEYGLKGAQLEQSSSSFVFTGKTKFLLNMDNASQRGIFISDGVEVKDGTAQGRNGEEVQDTGGNDGGGRILDTETQEINPRMISPDRPNGDVEMFNL